MKNKYALFVFIFFILGFINISFSLLGLICFTLPFIIQKKTFKNLWCKIYCPRKSFLNVMLSKNSLRIKKPKWFNLEKVKNFMLTYLTLNVIFATSSTLMVLSGKAPSAFPFDHIRFMMVVELFPLPQLINLNLPDALIHFSYRIYSIMFSSTILGLSIGFLFGPTFWCVVCPMNQYLLHTKTE